MPISAVNPLILVVEDDPAVRNLIVAALEAHGLRHMAVETAHAAIAAASSQTPSIVLLDLGLPDMDGVKVEESVRAWSGMPIIVVSARSEDADKIRALDAGADDYLPKPFAIEELFARIRVALKRSEAVRAASGVGGVGTGAAGGTGVGATAMPPVSDSTQVSASLSPATLAVGSVALDPDRREVTVGGSPIALTAREFDVLALLMAHAETVLTRERIAHEALGYEYMGDTNNVDVHIAHLRAKIEDAGGARIIQTVRGVGYVCLA